MECAVSLWANEYDGQVGLWVGVGETGDVYATETVAKLNRQQIKQARRYLKRALKLADG